MKISCPACNANYRLPDDKIQGKNRVFKINCKRCGAEIRVRGVETAEEVGRTTLPFALDLPAAAPPPATPAPVWYAGMQGQQVGPLTEAEVVAHIQSGQLTGTDLVWKKGFASWTPVAEVNPFATVAADVAAQNGQFGAERRGPRRAQTLELSAAMIELLVKLDGQAAEQEPSAPPQLPKGRPVSGAADAITASGAFLVTDPVAVPAAEASQSNVHPVATEEPPPVTPDVAQQAEAALAEPPVSDAAAAAAVAPSTAKAAAATAPIDLAKAAGAQADPANAEPAKAEPTKAEPAKAEPAKTAVATAAAAGAGNTGAAASAGKTAAAASAGKQAANPATASAAAAPAAAKTAAASTAGAAAAKPVVTGSGKPLPGQDKAAPAAKSSNTGTIAVVSGIGVALVAGFFAMQSGGDKPTSGAPSAASMSEPVEPKGPVVPPVQQQASPQAAVAAAPEDAAAAADSAAPAAGTDSAAAATNTADAAATAAADAVQAAQAAGQPDAAGATSDATGSAPVAAAAAKALEAAKAGDAAAAKTEAKPAAADSSVAAAAAEAKAAASAAAKQAATEAAAAKKAAEAEKRAADAQKKAESDAARKEAAEAKKAAVAEKRAAAAEAKRLAAEAKKAAEAEKKAAAEAKKLAAAEAKRAAAEAKKAAAGGDDDAEIERILAKQRAKAAGGGETAPAADSAGLSQSQVNSIADKVSGKVRNCYLMHADDSADGPETIKVTVMVQGDGSVGVAKVIGKYGAGSMGDCISKAVRTLAFPASSGASRKYTLTYRVGG